MDKVKYLEYLELKREVKKGIFKLLRSKVLKDKSEESIVALVEIKYKGYKNLKGMVRVLLCDLTWSKRFKCVNLQYKINEEDE